MKKTVIILLVLAISLFSCAVEQNKPSEIEMNRVQFNCDNGERVEVRFFPTLDKAVLVRNGKSVELKQQPSGSGFIYSNGPNTVRGKGREIMIDIGRMVPIRCEAV
jgi:membrane-bound inhibitor of C-type lysozyme